MNSDATDFISNIAHTTAMELIAKMKKASHYFMDDEESGAKCCSMHHTIVVNIIADYLMVMMEMSDLSSEELCTILSEDALELKQRIIDGTEY